MEDTIAAISTPVLGDGGIGIVRISGTNSIETADKIFRAANNRLLKEVQSHTIHYGFIEKDGKRIDEVLVAVMKGPRSYTAEDTVEINCHGGLLVTRKVLEAVIEAGARLAEPGEFTKRAFLNGRIDLTKAEAVIDVINAKNEYALKTSMEQLSGRISAIIKEIRDKILDNIAYMEAAMDDPENIPMNNYLNELSTGTEEKITVIKELIDSFDGGRLIKDGIDTVIVGKTNVGKSSLLNMLSGTESAIVTDIEGTTRDLVKERIKIGELTLNITDTAGIRETDDKVEAIGVKKALESTYKADLIIYVADGSRPVDGEDEHILKQIKNKDYITLINKSDLENVTTAEDLKAIGLNTKKIITISTKTGEGLEELKNSLEEMFKLGQLEAKDAPVITNVRHKNLLEKAYLSLNLAQEGINAGEPEDLLTIDLMDAYTYLGEILGEEIEDDLADRIFEKFCMGK